MNLLPQCLPCEKHFSLLVSAYYPTLKSFPRHVYKSKKLRMGIKIIRLKGLHSKQKRFWDILQKPDFIIGDSYYDFQAFISRLHLIGSPPNWVWWTILSQLIFDLLWSKSEIPTISKIKAREGANFGFSRFQPCLFSQIWRGSRIWTIKRKLRSVIGESPKFFSWSSDKGLLRYRTLKNPNFDPL